MMANDPLWGVQRDQITVLAARHALPAIYVNSENVEAGGLISYGASISYASRLGGTYVGRIPVAGRHARRAAAVARGDAGQEGSRRDRPLPRR
jgi:putative ABC transport system substrate-binding protein